MTIELEPTPTEHVAAILEHFTNFLHNEPQLGREFLWKMHYSLNRDEAEVHRMTVWLYWWDVWPVSWEDACDLISGVLTDEQRQLRIGGSRYLGAFGPGQPHMVD